MIPDLTPGPFREADRVCVIADTPPPGASPRFPGATGALAHHWVLRGADAAGRAERLLAAHRIDRAWLAYAAAPPPGDDLDPVTPTFDQVWRAAFPEGLGVDEIADFPGVTGEYVTVVDVEFAWDDTHEDLLHSATTLGGAADAQWAFHGNGVLGILAAGDNGFGVTGIVPAAAILVQHPYFPNNSGTFDYDVARAIVESLGVLAPGDVILLEQQAYGPDGEFVPISIEPGVREAIRAATAAGVVVVEPAGNDTVDLDDPGYAGAFTEDTGVIRVGGGAPSMATTPRSRLNSNWGSSVALQGWSSSIVTTGGSGFADLFYPDADPRQAYTSEFAGTSGAAALVAGVCAATQSVAIATRGAPLTPAELRAALVSTGTAPPEGSDPVGALPDLRRVLRTNFVP